MIEAKTILNITLLQVIGGAEIALYLAWIAILAIGIILRVSKKKQLREAHSNYEFKLDKKTFDSFNNKLKSDYFDKGQSISKQDFGTYSTTFKKVVGLFVERVMINGKISGFRVYKSLQEYESSKPTIGTIDDEKLEEEYYQWLDNEATEEDLKEIFGEPKTLSEEERSRIERNSKLINENDDDLPF